MLLHTDKNLFEQTIFQVAQRSGIESGIIEKDYYVSLLLKELSQTLPSMIFKGGTSLSKCHKVIKRFSEDIDITLDENHLSQGNRKSVKTAIVNACEKLGFSISNLDDIKSGMDFNHYKIEYSGLFMIDGLKPDIEIDTIFSIRSFPYEQKLATSIIYDYLHEEVRLCLLLNLPIHKTGCLISHLLFLWRVLLSRHSLIRADTVCRCHKDVSISLLFCLPNSNHTMQKPCQ